MIKDTWSFLGQDFIQNIILLSQSGQLEQVKSYGGERLVKALKKGGPAIKAIQDLCNNKIILQASSEKIGVLKLKIIEKYDKQEGEALKIAKSLFKRSRGDEEVLAVVLESLDQSIALEVILRDVGQK